MTGKRDSLKRIGSGLTTVLRSRWSQNYLREAGAVISSFGSSSYAPEPQSVFFSLPFLKCITTLFVTKLFK